MTPFYIEDLSILQGFGICGDSWNPSPWGPERDCVWRIPRPVAVLYVTYCLLPSVDSEPIYFSLLETLKRIDPNM
jgi:hypothetical protein